MCSIRRLSLEGTIATVEFVWNVSVCMRERESVKEIEREKGNRNYRNKNKIHNHFSQLASMHA